MLLDSGHLHEEFAKREARWEKRHPDEVEADDRKESDAYQAAVDLAAAAGSEEEVAVETAGAPEGSVERPAAVATAVGSTIGEHVPTSVEAAPERPGAWPRDPEEELRRQPPQLDVDLDAPLYTVKDAERALEHFRAIGYDEPREIAPGIEATFLDAGHILGSAIIRLVVRDREGGEERVIVCSGDLGRPGTPILRDPTVMTAADYVLVESTYGGREHEPQDEAIRILVETIKLVDEAKGVLLVPSFAIGRTQEVVWELDRLIDQGRIPLLPLYLDSPMASKASDIYRRHPDYYDEETAQLLREGDTPLDYPNQIVTNDIKASQAIERAPRPYMIVASNGMLTGGRVVGHLRHLIDDPAATILFVGYQGEGTLGAHLQAGAKTVRIDGQQRAGPLPGPLDQRLLGPCRRDGAARLAARVHQGQATRRPGLSAAGLPRPRRPGGAGRPRAQGPGARARHPRPALARAGHARLTAARAARADRRTDRRARCNIPPIRRNVRGNRTWMADHPGDRPPGGSRWPAR